MSVIINTNFAATAAANNLAASNASLQKSLNRLSSGSKIVSPADDAGGLAVAMKLTAAARRSGASATNISNALSYLQTQDGVLKVTSKILERMSELATLYSDETKEVEDLADYSAEFTQLVTEATNLAAETFNGNGLMDGTTTITTYTTEAGADGSSITTTATTADAASCTIDDLAGIKAEIIKLGTDRAANGAVQSTLGFAAEVLSVNKANLEAAASRIVDVDVADESTQLARWNVLVQSGTAMLAQANQSPQSVLKLLG